MIAFLKQRAIWIITSLGILAGGLGSLYAFADSLEFALDRPAWKSELDVQGEVLYDLAADNVLNRLDRAERRLEQLQRRRADPRTSRTPDQRRILKDDYFIYRDKVRDLKRDYRRYNKRRK